MQGQKGRSRAGRKHTQAKNKAFQDFEQAINERATEEIFSFKNLSNPHTINRDGHQYALVDVQWESTREYLNNVCDSLDEIRTYMNEEDQAKLDEIVKNDEIRNSFEATRNIEGEES